jgi:intracellular sulfur oxidation DsrE/DsrF family protein
LEVAYYYLYQAQSNPMQIKTTFLVCCLLACTIGYAQKGDAKPGTMSKKDSILLAKLKARGIYPLIKASPFCGVMPGEGVTEKPDNTTRYKLLFNFTAGTRDAEKAKILNRGLAEIGRIINLHIAAGIPKQNLDIVIVTHGPALYALVKNEAYKKEFKTDNPNLIIVKELEDAGSNFIACNQAMQFLDIEQKDLDPSAKIALSAKTALSTYQLKGYVVYYIEDD